MICDPQNVFFDLLVEPVLTGLATAIWLIFFVKLADSYQTWRKRQ